MRRRRRSLVLVPAALLSAACTRTRQDDNTAAEDALSRDLTLATQMENRPVDPARGEAPNGRVCAAQPVPAAPGAKQRQEAAALAQRAQQAEVVGDTRTARDLFARAAQIDGTDKDVVYHLARADEALGRTGDAAREYCQYLSLVPGAAGAAEANARLAALGTAKKGGATVVASSAGATQRTPWRSPSAASRMRPSLASPKIGGGATQVASAAGSRQSSASDMGSTPSTMTGEAAGRRAAAAPDAGASAPAIDTTSATAPEAVMATTTPQQTTTSASSRPTTTVRRQQSHVARNTAIGAAAGAAVGGIMTHSVKGAGIGAIAGGLLGAVSGRGSGLVRTPGFAR